MTLTQIDLLASHDLDPVSSLQPVACVWLPIKEALACLLPLQQQQLSGGDDLCFLSTLTGISGMIVGMRRQVLAGVGDSCLQALGVGAEHKAKTLANSGDIQLAGKPIHCIRMVPAHEPQCTYMHVQ